MVATYRGNGERYLSNRERALGRPHPTDSFAQEKGRSTTLGWKWK